MTLRSVASKLQLLAFSLASVLAAPLAAQEVNTRYLSENGWYSDDTRADGSGSLAAGTNLISDSMTDDPEQSGSGTSTHDSDILGQIFFVPAPSGFPSGTHDGAVRLFIDGVPAGAASGKSQISHRKDDLTGHGPGSGFGPGFTAEYSWMGNGTLAVTASLKFGIKTSEFGSTPVSTRTGENAWDKVLIYEPGNLNGGTSNGTWFTETIDWDTGKWWFFDRTAGAGIIGTPMTLEDMSTSATLVGGGPKTVADVYDLITASGAIITSVQFGIGSGNAGGSVYVNQMTTNVYRSGMTTTFGCNDEWYYNGFETDHFGWNVFAGTSFDMARVASGTNGVTSASGSWHAEADTSAGNWGGYSAVCACASTTCAGPVSSFPTGGYVTSIDIYIDVDGGWTDDTRFDFSSAINNTTGSHRRDFVFTGQYLEAANPALPGAGSDRFLFAASNNTPGWPAGGVDPVAVTETGWYTFEHHFYDSGAGVLACDFVIKDADGDEVASWTRSDPSDVIGTTVGGNRYGWFVTNGFPFLAFDNAERRPGPYDQDVTPDAIFGSGNANGSFTVDRQDGVELGLRGKLRFPPSNIFNSNGDGTYTFSTGSGTSTFPNPEWGFEWSINTDYDDSTGDTVGDLTYEIGMDFDPGAGTNYLAFDHVTPGEVLPYTTVPPPTVFWDHSMGDNTTPNGGGLEAASGPTYLSYLSTYNVAQNSWRMTFFDELPFVFDPDVPGRYEFYMAAFDGGDEVARTAITVLAMDGATLSLEAVPCQVDQEDDEAGVQIAVELWLRNPDDEEITGWQAFLAFDDSEMTYEGALSSYTPAPFGFHIQPILTAEVAAGELRLDGNTFPSSIGTTGDEKLATLYFTVDECDENDLVFDLGQPFDSEVSFLGSPIATDLLDATDVVGDDTPPSIATNSNITQPADADIGDGCVGAIVTYTNPLATDNCDVSVDVVCDLPSGSEFPVGTTTVTCTATDDCGNTDSSTFDVTITGTNLVGVVVTLDGVAGPVSRCIRFERNGCVGTDVTLLFSGFPATFAGDIELPCGVMTTLCAKDEQHTKWDDTTLTLVGTKYVAATTLLLEGGDTDNDGDVDINDVTLFLAQFGDPASPGGCPWDGVTRDADFDDNGAVGSPDYAFLVDNWLTLSACTCLPATGGRGGPGPLLRWLPVQDTLTARADLDSNGRVDVRDVELFEETFGFSGALSERMRTSGR